MRGGEPLTRRAPPHRIDENQLDILASRVERNCASTKSYLRSVSPRKISSLWCVTVTMVAVMSPESHTEASRSRKGTSAEKAAQCAASRAASPHFLSLRTYRIESNRQYKKRTEKGMGQ